MKKLITFLGLLILLGAGCVNKEFSANDVERKKQINQAFANIVNDATKKISDNKAIEINNCENKFSVTDFNLSFCYSKKWGEPGISSSTDPVKGMYATIYFNGITGPKLTVFNSEQSGYYQCIKCLKYGMSDLDVLKNLKKTSSKEEVQRFDVDGIFGYRVKDNQNQVVLYYIPNAIKKGGYDIILSGPVYSMTELDAFISTMKF